MRGNIEAFTTEMIGGGRIAIYGLSPCGKLAKRAIERLGGCVEVVIDRLKESGGFEGVPVKPYEAVGSIKGYRVINCASANFWNITDFLFAQGADTVYHALELLDTVPKDDQSLELCDARAFYRSCIENGRGRLSENWDEFSLELRLIHSYECSI